MEEEKTNIFEMPEASTRETDILLLKKVKDRLGALEALLTEARAQSDLFYRLYHQSFKVYRIQELTQKIVAALRDLAPLKGSLDRMFEEIVAEGASGKVFQKEHNEHWSKETRPMLEAFFHARQFLEFAVEAGKTLEFPPTLLPSGWAALLELYNVR